MTSRWCHPRAKSQWPWPVSSMLPCSSLKHNFPWLLGSPLCCFHWLLPLSSWSHVGVPWTTSLSTCMSLVYKLMSSKLIFLVMTSPLTPYLCNGGTYLYQKWSKDGIKVKISELQQRLKTTYQNFSYLSPRSSYLLPPKNPVWELISLGCLGLWDTPKPIV